MKNKALSILSTMFAGMLLFASLMNVNLPRKYRPGDFVKEENAYFVEEITDPAGLIKAQKFVTPSDGEYNTQKSRFLAKSLIGDIEKTWDSYTGAGTTIAIIDDGFDVNHPEYRRSDNSSAISPASRYYYSSGSSAYYQSYSDNPSCIDEKWEHDEDYDTYEWATHGTATSTTAAAPMGNGGGVGIAPDATLLLLKTNMSFVAIRAAIQYAIDQGVDVINMSLGAYAESFTDGWGDSQSGSASTATYLNDVCQNAYNAGVIVVAAAGNEATYHKSYPACNTKVIAAGATGDWDNKGNANVLAEFTNYVGSSQTGEINVDILAPGYVWTAHKSGTESTPTHVYDDIQGTSFSSPIIAGAAALWKQKHPTGTPDEFLAKLQGSADGIGDYKNQNIPVSGWYSSLTDPGPSNIENGRLNVSNLLDVTPYVYMKSTLLNVASGSTKQINVDSYSGTLTYSSNNTSVATVNSSGVVTGVSDGSTKIRITSTVGGKTAYKDIDVYVATEITDVEFNPNSISIHIGDTYNAKDIANITPSNAPKDLMFESSNPSIATVDVETGVVTGVSAGTTYITVIPANGDCSDTLTVEVKTATTQTVTYTVVNSSSASTSGTAPTGSSITFSNTYSTAEQMTSGKKQTWTIKGYKDLVISSLKAHLHRNSSKGYGTLELKNNGSTVTLGKSIDDISKLSPSYSEYELLLSSFTVNGDVVLTIQASENSIYCDYIKVTYSEPDTSDKIVKSLSASYSGGDLYVGDSLDVSKVSVTATFTDSGKYPNEVLESSKYSITGFSSATAGNKVVTVTYTGELEKSTDPMTTTFNVLVKNDTITSVTPSVSKAYHPGGTIVKSDITLTLGYESGKSSTTTDFTFSDDGYQFTYDDAPSGGSNGQKEFSITYNNNDYNFSVNVSRVASNAPSTSALKGTITGNQAQAAGIKVGTGTSAANYTDIYIGGIKCNVENGYVYNNSGYYLSFGKTAGSIYNKEPLAYPLLSVSISQKSGSRSDAKYYLRTEKGTWTSLGTCDFINNDYRYFKVAFESSSTSYSNISSISLNSYIDTVANVCNYIMYQDTENQCLTKLDVALTRLNTMSNTDKSSFWNSNDYVIKTARTRLEAWAVNQGKTLTYSNNSFAISSAKVININQLNISLSDYSYLIYILIAGITLGGVMLYFIYRKKRLDK